MGKHISLVFNFGSRYRNCYGPSRINKVAPLMPQTQVGMVNSIVAVLSVTVDAPYIQRISRFAAFSVFILFGVIPL